MGRGACRFAGVSGYLASAAQPESKLGVVVGTQGQMAGFEGETLWDTCVEGAPDLSAAALDGAGGVWLGGAGTLWVQKDRSGPIRMAHRTNVDAPFVAIHADIDQVLAITASGGIVEGRGFG